MESLKRIILGRASDNTYGVVTERKDNRTYIIKIGDEYAAATWGGEALVNGDTVLINRTKLGVVITQRLGMAGDVEPVVMVIEQ